MQENIWFSLFSGNTFKTKSNHANFSSMVSIGIDQYVAQFGYNDFKPGTSNNHIYSSFESWGKNLIFI
tara:strand:- start:1247 stop:1450 length:204 start_codon:yes stop_codon:yes gene_type:complete